MNALVLIYNIINNFQNVVWRCVHTKKYPVILVYELSILDRSCDADVMVCTQLVIDLLQ